MLGPILQHRSRTFIPGQIPLHCYLQDLGMQRPLLLGMRLGLHWGLFDGENWWRTRTI